MSLKTYLVGSAAIAGALTAVAPAHAQSTATLNRQIEALQEQVRALNQQLQSLHSQVVQTQRNKAVTAETVTQMKATPAPAASGVVASMPNNRPTLSIADGRNTISLVGRVHWDVGDYVRYHAENTHSPAATTATPANLNSGQNVRRGRLGIQGKVLGDWNDTLIYDFGGSQDSGAGGIDSSGIETAEIGYSGFRPLTIEGGIQDVPWTLDESISSNDIMFIERASPEVIAANLVAGDFRSN